MTECISNTRTPNVIFAKLGGIPMTKNSLLLSTWTTQKIHPGLIALVMPRMDSDDKQRSADLVRCIDM